MDKENPPMILPKGIVVNTTTIYKEVANHKTLPIEKIWRYWHVYTTTNQRLEDPTARRLENFWWHVWGSDRRMLRGRTLAKLYEDISTGPTFVPLRGPPNRWEPPDVPARAPEAVFFNKGQPTVLESGQGPLPKGKDAAGKSFSSSASRPPPSHPILKKARGPSSSGPRPTARFLSPHASEDEVEVKAEAEVGVEKRIGSPSPESTANASLDMRSSSKGAAAPSKKKAPNSTKRFVVASNAAKRRPQLPPRRSSSQSSTITDNGSRDSSSSVTSRNSGSQRAVSPIVEQQSTNASPRSAESQEPVAIQSSSKLSAKALGKQPVGPRYIESSHNGSTATPHGSAQKQGSTPRIDAPLAPQNRRQKPEPLPQVQALANKAYATSPTTEPMRSPLSPVAASSSFGLGAVAAPTAMARSQSHTGSERYRTTAMVRNLSSHGLFTGATASTTNVAAQGTIIDQSGLSSLPASTTFPQRSGAFPIPHRPSAGEASLLDSRLTPTQPSPVASLPLGRTRSQLTLVLEREKARLGDKARPKS